MPNKDKILEKMKEMGLSKEAVSAFLKISLNSLNNKLGGKTQFSMGEAQDLATLLKLSAQQCYDIFFA